MGPRRVSGTTAEDNAKCPCSCKGRFIGGVVPQVEASRAQCHHCQASRCGGQTGSDSRWMIVPEHTTITLAERPSFWFTSMMEVIDWLAEWSALQVAGGSSTLGSETNVAKAVALQPCVLTHLQPQKRQRSTRFRHPPRSTTIYSFRFEFVHSSFIRCVTRMRSPGPSASSFCVRIVGAEESPRVARA